MGNCGRWRLEAKTVGVPPLGANFKISPFGNGLASVTKRFPEASKARPRALVSPLAKMLPTPVEVNL